MSIPALYEDFNKPSTDFPYSFSQIQKVANQIKQKYYPKLNSEDLLKLIDEKYKGFSKFSRKLFFQFFLFHIFPVDRHRCKFHN